MIKSGVPEKLDDFFVELGKRRGRCVYFCRINGYNPSIHAFLRRYYEAARLSGVIIEGKLQNPDNRNLAYYNEIMGMEFRLERGFISASLKKWLPRMKDAQRESVADSICHTLTQLRQAGKTDSMLKNAYIKFMCWLYYKFERIVNHLGQEQLPKILYEGSVSSYELLLMNVLSGSGCDIVLLQYQGDTAYLKVDPDSTQSGALQMPGMTDFPSGFSLRQILAELQEETENKRLYGTRPERINCTNAWITGRPLEDVRKEIHARGNDDNLFYNCFCRIVGVEDRLTYQNELYQLQLELKNRKRRLVIVNDRISPPSVDEISAIQRNSYRNIPQLIQGLSVNYRSLANQELQRLVHTAFVDILLEEGKRADKNINRLTNQAVYLLCWFRRYQQQLFNGWKVPEISCFFYMGGCRSENEALFCRFLARLPVDVLIFNPNLNQKCCLEDRMLFEVTYPESLAMSRYPEENAGMRIGTAAYQAERDLDSLMYQDSGLYRNQQYTRANSVCLQTMYEEIAILWGQELKYRPNFSTVDDVVNIPVLFSKICGVKNSDVPAYWRSIKNLMTPDALLITQASGVNATGPNPVKPFATQFFRNGRLMKERIRTHKAYQYGILRAPVQEHLLDKLQLLIEQKTIRGTFENGTEYTILSTALNLDKKILRMIQKFDFTKNNPKLIYLLIGEKALTLEETISMAFLNLVGFDIVFFVPTGYRCVEQYLNRTIMEEHQIGEYLYDLQVPDFDTISSESRPTWHDRFFKRGT